MANLDNFTIDEQLILIHIIRADILSSAIVQLTQICAESLRTNTAIICGKSIAKLDERQARLIIEDARSQNKSGIKQLRADIAEGKI